MPQTKPPLAPTHPEQAPSDRVHTWVSVVVALFVGSMLMSVWMSGSWSEGSVNSTQSVGQRKIVKRRSSNELPSVTSSAPSATTTQNTAQGTVTSSTTASTVVSATTVAAPNVTGVKSTPGSPAGDSASAATQPIDQRDTSKFPVQPPAKIDKDSRFVSIAWVRPYYGLTNIMMTYAGLFSFAALAGRIPMPPVRTPRGAPRFDALFDIQATRDELSRITTIRNIMMQDDPDSPNKDGKIKMLKKFGYGLASRHASEANPVQAADLAKYIGEKTAGIHNYALGDMFKVFPFRGVPYNLSECAMLAAFRFKPEILETVDTVTAKLKALGHTKYYAVHLRLEPVDASLIIKGKVTPPKLSDFMMQHIIPVAKKLGASAIVTCSGDLDPKMRAALKSLNFPVYSKKDLMDPQKYDEMMKYEVREYNRGVKANTTSPYGAAVDMTLMERAVGVAMKPVSTFSRGVYSRRCARSPTAARFHAYAVRTDGTVTPLGCLPCGYLLCEAKDRKNHKYQVNNEALSALMGDDPMVGDC